MIMHCLSILSANQGYQSQWLKQIVFAVSTCLLPAALIIGNCGVLEVHVHTFDGHTIEFVLIGKHDIVFQVVLYSRSEHLVSCWK